MSPVPQRPANDAAHQVGPWADVEAYLRANSERVVEERLDLLRIPSVSTDPERAADVALVSDGAMVAEARHELQGILASGVTLRTLAVALGAR